MDSRVKQVIMQIVDEMPASFSALPGEVFSSGSSAIAKGDFYLAGLNPMAGGA